MIPIYINGLCPGRDDGLGDDNGGTRVGVFDIEIDKGEPGREILLRYANTEGEIEDEIPDEFIGKQVKLVIRDVGFKFLEGVETVKHYGLVYTARLEKDHVYNGRLNNPEAFATWNTETQYSQAKDKAHEKVREFRHRNHIAIAFHIVVVFIAAFAGLFISGFYGVLIALVLALVLEFTAPFSMGLRPFRLTRRSTRTRQSCAG